MPTYLFVALFVASFILPTVAAFGTAIYVRGYSRYFVGLLSIMLAIGVHAGLANYSWNIYPEWWDSRNDSTILLAMAYMFVGVIGNLVGIALAIQLGENIDEEQPSDNVRQFRRSA